MDEECLHPAFEPARPLAKPAPGRCGCLFKGRGLDHSASVADARKTHAEVGVLGHCVAEARKTLAGVGVLGDVVGVPAARLTQSRGPEMVGGAAKWQRQAEPGKLWKKDIEVAGIFGGKIAGKPSRVGVDAERCLHACKVISGGSKCFQRTTKLL